MRTLRCSAAARVRVAAAKVSAMSDVFPTHEPECSDTESDAIELLISRARSRHRRLRGAPRAARRAQASGRAVHLLRSHGPGGDAGRAWARRAPASAHRARHRDVPVRRRDRSTATASARCSTIRPGDVNWMVAGRGIVHSERSGQGARHAGVHLHGIQSWVALPLEHEETEPRFEHHPAATLPKLQQGRRDARRDRRHARSGSARRCAVFSPTLYVHARLDAGARVQLDAEHEQRAVYVVEGDDRLRRPRRSSAGALLVLRSGVAVTLASQQAARADADRRRQARRRAPHLLELRREHARRASSAQRTIGATSAFPEGAGRRGGTHSAARGVKKDRAHAHEYVDEYEYKHARPRARARPRACRPRPRLTRPTSRSVVALRLVAAPEDISSRPPR